MTKKTPLLIKFANVVREARKKAGLSQEELAERADVHRTYIGMVERAEKNITLTNIGKLSKALKIPLGKLFEKVDKAKHTLTY